MVPLKLLWPHRLSLVAGLACMAVLAAANALHAYLTGPLLQLVLSGGQQQGSYLAPLLRLLLPEGPPDLGRTLVAVTALLVGTAAVKGLAHLGQAVLLDGTARRVGHQLRVRLYRHLMRLPLQQHRQRPLGELVARLLDDIRRVQQAAVSSTVDLARHGLSMLALATVAVALAPRLALAAALALPLVGLVIAGLSARVKRAAGQGQQQVGQMSARATQGLGAVREVKSCGAEEREVRAFGDHSAQALRWALRRIAVRATSPLINEVLASLALGLTLLYAGERIASGSLAAERFISFFVAVILMYRPIKGIGQAVHLAAAGKASVERVTGLLELAAERPDEGATLPALEQALTLKGVGFRYPGADVPALQGVDLVLPVGQVTALAGPSGAGKTTLANMVCGLERPGEGRLLWDDQDLAQSSLNALRSMVALVPQQPLLLDGTVADNLRYGAPHATDEQVRQAVAAAGLEPVLAALPEGLETTLGSGGVQLSAGEVQRLALARALARRVRVLVLDEPSSALDPDNEATLVRTLRSVGRDHAVLVIAHSEALLAAADRVVRLERT